MQEKSSRPARAQVETGIFRRGRHYTVRIGVNGRQVERGARTLAEARHVRAELRTDPPSATNDSRVTLATYADAWLAGYAGRTTRGVADSTLTSYRRALARHVLPELGRTRIGTITPAAVKRLSRSLGATMKPASVRRTLAPLRALLADAEAEGVIRVSPFRSVRLPGDADLPPDERVKSLTDEQVAELLAAVPEGADRLLVRLLAATGLRRSEALALRWSDLDPRRVRVRRAIKVDGRIGPPKTAAGVRAVPLPPGLHRDLLVMRADAPEGALVFAGPDGALASPGAFGSRFARYARRAGVPWATAHNLRHTFASRALRSDRPVNVKALSVMLGHKDVGTTLNIYSHLLSDDLPAALPEIVPAGPETAAPVETPEALEPETR
jgi:integrase